MPASSAADVYDGTIPFPDTGAGSLPLGGPAQVAVTSVIAVIPLAGLAVAIWLARPFTTRRFDRATNLWPLALLSFGESWHNLHHSDPTSARHGVGLGQIDLSAGLIALFERLGWATDVRWPSPGRVESRRRAASPGPEDAPAADEVAGTPGSEPERAPAPAAR
jgi:hypothetical protein